MIRPSLALALATLGAAALFSQVYAAAPAPSPAANPAAPGAPAAGARRGAAGGGRGGAAPIVVAPGTSGYPGGVAVDPAVARKAKWPVRTPDTAPIPGYVQRSPGNNGFYKRDADGNILPGTDLYNFAESGHFTNYDQDDIPNYVLPDPLLMQDGRRVTSAEMWVKERRPELINIFKDNIYGRVPEDKLPKIIWEVKENEKSDDGKTTTKVIVGHFEGTTPDPTAHVDPNGRGGGGGFGGAGGRAGRGARGVPGAPGAPAAGGPPATPVPGVANADGTIPPAPPAPAAVPGAPRAGRGGRGGRGGGGPNTITITLTIPNVGHPPPIFFGGPVNDPIGHGWATGSISGDAGMLGRISPPDGQEPPGNFPGAYARSGWQYSRAMDYLVTDKDVDGSKVTIAGASTGGKQVLFAAAMDDRIWCVVPESSGAMGVKLSRRDIGEVVDTLAVQFIGNYCPNFKRYIGHWNDLPIDQHEMIALMAPRKMFITGGNGELWEDVKGGFLAAVAAEPVYTLLGKKGVYAVDLPPIERPIVNGEIGFYQHNGGHMYTANERQWVTMWMEKYLPTSSAAK